MTITAMLYDYSTGEAIREATPSELAASVVAAETDGGVGCILVDGVTVYAQANSTPISQKRDWISLTVYELPDAEELEAMPDLEESYTCNLKMEQRDGDRALRVWLHRTSVEDGEPFINTVTVEGRDPLTGAWRDVIQYDGDALADMIVCDRVLADLYELTR